MFIPTQTGPCAFCRATKAFAGTLLALYDTRDTRDTRDIRAFYASELEQLCWLRLQENNGGKGGGTRNV